MLLGAWLFLSPWAFGYALDSPMAINAMASGAIMAVLAAFDLYKTYAWAVIANLLIGTWVAVSPWVGIMADRGVMMVNAVTVGVAVVVLALWELRADPDLHRQWAGPGHP